jgi:hypothetical protein
MPETETKPPRTALLVLGMHRSGTSLLSGLIAEAGVELGPTLMPAAPDNPRGFWENQRIVDLHERVLSHFDQTWSSAEPLPPEWHRQDGLVPLKDELRQIVQEEFGDTDLFCVKDPRLCRLLPLWRDLCEETGTRPVCVLISRPMEEVAASLQARDGLGQAHAEALWLRYCLEMLENVAGLGAVRARYSDLLVDPTPTLKQIAGLVGRPLELSGSELVDPSLRHHERPTHEKGPAWAEALLAHLEDDSASLPPQFGELVTPLVSQLAEAERKLNQALVAPEQLDAEQLQTAKESLLFEQAEDARKYAASMNEELTTGRAYIENMEQELQTRQDYAKSLEAELAARDTELATRKEYAESLEQALRQKEADLKSMVAGYEEDIARREEHTQSLLRELESTRAQLEEELQRFRYLRKASELLQGNRKNDE